jgi:hypothetical protein
MWSLMGSKGLSFAEIFRRLSSDFKSVMATKPLDDRIGAIARTAGCPFEVLLYHLLLNAMLA